MEHGGSLHEILLLKDGHLIRSKKWKRLSTPACLSWMFIVVSFIVLAFSLGGIVSYCYPPALLGVSLFWLTVDRRKSDQGLFCAAYYPVWWIHSCNRGTKRQCCGCQPQLDEIYIWLWSEESAVGVRSGGRQSLHKETSPHVQHAATLALLVYVVRVP